MAYQHIKPCVEVDDLPQPDIHDRESCMVIVMVEDGGWVSSVSHDDADVDPFSRLNDRVPHTDHRIS